MVKHKSPRRHRHTPVPQQEPKPPSRFWKYAALAAPLAGGALVGADKYQSCKREAASLLNEADRVEANFRREYREEALSLAGRMANDPRYEQMVADLRDGKEVTVGRYLQFELDILQENPTYVKNVLAKTLRASERIEALEGQAEQTQANASRDAWVAFGSSTGVAYVFVAIAYLWIGAKRLISNRMKELKRPTLKEAVEAAPAAPVEEEAEAKPEQGDSRSTMLPEPPLAEVVDIRTARPAQGLAQRPRPHQRQREEKAEEKRGVIFAKDVREEMLARGFDPKEVEKALIRGFKILSRNSILLGEHCAPSSGIHRDMKSVIGDEYRAAMVFALLDDEGLLLRHEEDYTSLNPNPDGALGKLVIRDIQEHVARMSGRGAQAQP